MDAAEARRMVDLHLRSDHPLIEVGEATEDPEGVFRVEFSAEGHNHLAEVTGWAPEETQIL